MWLFKKCPRSNRFTREQQDARAEWRNLCFVLEGLQASEVTSNGYDKYLVAKTYSIYGRTQSHVLAGVRAAIKRDDFSFFIDRGVPRNALNRELALAMLRDWVGAVASKRNRVEKYFVNRFKEDIDVFSATPANAVAMRAVTSLDSTDAILLLGWPPSDRSTPASPLRLETFVPVVFMPVTPWGAGSSERARLPRRIRNVLTRMK